MANRTKKPVETRKRQAVAFDEEWHEVMSKLASAAKQPIKWFVIEMLIEKAKAAGIETPPAPWERQ